VLTFWGYDKPVPDNFELKFEPVGLVVNEPLALFGDNEIHLNAWYGNITLADVQSLEITLIWSTTRQLRHEYQSLMQVQTQEFERVAGDEDFVFIQRWVYPSTVWQIGDVVPDTHIFSIPPDLQAGAYRLVAGIKYSNYPPLEATSAVGETVNNLATIGWLKVPQAEVPRIPGTAVPVDIKIGDSFQLTYIEAIPLENGQTLVRLYWQSLVNRPAIDATIFVHATDTTGVIAAQSDLRPWGGQYPTFIWDAGEIVVSQHLLATETLGLANLNLRVGMYTFPGPQNLPAIIGEQEVESGLIELGALLDYVP
jgi:hypothetical protein